MKEVQNDYYIGLDIGTNSVGWAVTDLQYNILRKKGKSMWGIRLFEEAKTAAERRVARTNRRRLQRQKQRIELLQEIFGEEISKVDDKFFIRLKDSSFVPEDKKENQTNSIFNDIKYKDKDYNDEFKTIYHLRKALIMGEKEYDVRLVYLAIHHMMKNRGHFLFDSNIANITSFDTTFNAFKICMEEEFGFSMEEIDEGEFEKILKNKSLSRTKKSENLLKICGVEKKDEVYRQFSEIIKLIIGLNCKVSVIFNSEAFEEIEHNKICFGSGNYDETRVALEDEIQEKAGIIDILQAVYNWTILSDILEGGEYNGKSYISIAKVGKYEKHHNDLKKLKELVKKYCTQENYNDFFVSNEKDNYCAYIGKYMKNGKVKVENKKCSQEDFYKAVKKLLDKMNVDNDVDEAAVTSIKNDIESKTFLQKQVSKDNGVIPYQVNKIELECILENAKEYLPFLNEVDESCNLTNAEKIVKLFEYKIPYYVGPINTARGDNCWMIRNEGKEGERITPWNFNDVVDVDLSAEKFIKHMTNKCTYLSKEDVLPKYSLLYTEYMVLNEINNIKVKGVPLDDIDIKLRKGIYNELFKKEKRVSKKRIAEYIKSMGYDATKEDISGVDVILTTSLSSYIELKKIFGDKLDTYSFKQVAEDIIKWITIYGDDQKMLKRVIKKHYESEITPEQLKQVCRLKIQGWGRLSEKLLTGLEGTNKDTGEITTIINELRNTNRNFMQIVASNDYTFAECIDDENMGYKVEEVTYDNIVKDVVASPAIKRAVWQTIQIVEEIKQVMGKAPARIFVEMARGEEEKKRTISRKDKLLECYKEIDKECKTDWVDELNKIKDTELKSIKLFLYFTQMGKCMYTGKKIDISQLDNATIWDRDHIYPQSKVKDDSLDNLVLVARIENAKKSDGMLSPEIQSKMYGHWKYLKDKGLISEKKFNRLTRKEPFSDDELAGFISRQLVETRQSTKVVATLLNRIYGDTKVVYVKAGVTADFKNHKDSKTGERDYIHDVKVRSINDYHHAKDAYLNIVVGNVYFTKFTDNPYKWFKDRSGKRDENKYKYSLNRMFDFDLMEGENVVWKRGKDGTLKTVNEVLSKNDILYTRYAYCNKGLLFDQLPVKAPNNEEKAEKLVPAKKGRDTIKYGGYNSISPSHFMLVESKDKKGNFIRTIESVPLYLKEVFEKDNQKLIEYCINRYDLKEPRIVIPVIKKSSLLVINGFPMHLNGSTGKQLILQGAVQLCVSNEDAAYIKKLEKYADDNAKRKDKKELLKIDEYRGITKEQNKVIYEKFLEKLNNGIYTKRPANPVKKLMIAEDKFVDLKLEEQSFVLMQIIILLQCNSREANMSLIECGGRVGTMQVNKNITSCKSAKLINQSPTGLYENVIDLLRV